MKKKGLPVGKLSIVVTLVLSVVASLLVGVLIFSQHVSADGEWKTKATFSVVHVRTRDTDNDGRSNELHIDLNGDDKIDDDEPYITPNKGTVRYELVERRTSAWGYVHYSRSKPPFHKVWAIVHEVYPVYCRKHKLYWKIYGDKNENGKIDPEEYEDGIEKTYGCRVGDTIGDLVHIYTGEPVPENEYVGYLDVVEARAGATLDSVEFHVIVESGIPPLEHNTFFTVLMDVDNDPNDNCFTYPNERADTMYSLNLKNGLVVERATYQLVGDWWMVETTEATASLMSAWPNGDTEIVFYVPKTELQELGDMMPWRLVTDSDPYGIGDFAPEKEMVYLPLTLPKPWISSPLDGETLSEDNVTLRTRDMTFYRERPDTFCCSFEYSLSPDGPWTEIGTDFDPVDGWGVSWNLTGLPEGKYFLVATMLNWLGEEWSSETIVFYDSTPPIPQFHELSYGDVVEGLTTLKVVTVDENVRYVEFFYFNNTERKEKDIPGLCQTEIGTNPGVQDLHNGKYSCGPTAAASCLAYWGNYENETGQQPFKDLYNGTKEGIIKMARDLYDLCRTNQDQNNPGTFADKLKDGINDYIKSKKLGDKLEAKFIEKGSWTKARNEFMSCQDVILLVSRPDRSRHWITLSGVENVTDQKGQKTTYVEFMEPWCGIEEATAVLKDGKLQMDWNGDGEMKDDELASIVHIVTVCPKDRKNCPKDPLIGVDYDGTDGWSIEWNTTQMQDGSYLIYARMVDEDDNEGSNVTVVDVRNRLVTDLNGDRVVNIIDIYTAAKAFGSKPGDENWNPVADLDGNNKINIIDLYKIARDFGKTY